MTTRTILVRQFVEAMALNGYKQSRAGLLELEMSLPVSEIISACAVGQAALNLGVERYDLVEELNRLPYVGDIGLYKYIYRKNDDETKTPAEIAASLAKYVDQYGDDAIMVQIEDYSKYVGYQGVKV